MAKPFDLASYIWPDVEQNNQPQQPLPIDWSNPATAGLVGSYTPIDNGFVLGGKSSIVGNITQSIGSVGKCWKGAYQASNNYVKIERTAAFGYTNQFAFEVLFKVNAFQTATFPYISGLIGQYQSGEAVYYGPMLRFNHDATLGSASRLGIAMQQSGGTIDKSAVNPANMNAGQVYHAVGSYDGATLALDVDGVRVASTAVTGAFDNNPNNFISLLSDYVVSAESWNHNRCLNGEIYLARIYNKGKTEAESRYLYENAWRLYKEPANNLYFIPVASGASDLSGLAQSSAVATAAITQALALTGGSIAIATAAGVLNQSIGLAGSAASISVANGVATLTTELSGAGLIAAFASGAINQAMALEGSAQAAATATGGLGGDADLSGAVQAAATAAAQINLTLALSGAAVIAALATADLSVDSPGLSGAATGAAAATGYISIAVPAAGSANVAATGSGELSSATPIAGAAVAGASGSADLTVIPSGFSGGSIGAAIATGALFANVPISGAAPITVIGSGGLSSTLAITGAAVSVATGTGDLTVGIGGLTGHALADALAGGSISMSVSLSASALMQAIAAAQLSVAYPYVLPHGEYSIRRLTPRYSIKRAA